MSDNTIEPIVKQAASLLELVFDEAMRRASERHGQLEALVGSESLWVEGNEAVKIMGAGYTLSRLQKQLGHQGVIVMDRKDPDKPNSPYIFLRSSLHDYSVRRVFELDDKRAR